MLDPVKVSVLSPCMGNTIPTGESDAGVYQLLVLK